MELPIHTVALARYLIGKMLVRQLSEGALEGIPIMRRNHGIERLRDLAREPPPHCGLIVVSIGLI